MTVLRRLVLALMALLASNQHCLAQETIAVLSPRSGGTDLMPLIGNVANTGGNAGRGSPISKDWLADSKIDYRLVYTKDAVEARLKEQATETDTKVSNDLTAADARQTARMNSLGKQVMQAINATAARMEGQLLTPEARVRLTEEIVEVVHNDAKAHEQALRSAILILQNRIASLEDKVAGLSR